MGRHVVMKDDICITEQVHRVLMLKPVWFNVVMMRPMKTCCEHCFGQFEVVAVACFNVEELWS